MNDFIFIYFAFALFKKCLWIIIFTRFENRINHYCWQKQVLEPFFGCLNMKICSYFFIARFYFSLQYLIPVIAIHWATKVFCVRLIWQDELASLKIWGSEIANREQLDIQYILLTTFFLSRALIIISIIIIIIGKRNFYVLSDASGLL